MSQPGRILFVCTANICRSPTAEYLARRNFESGNWIFRSAGFLASGRAPSNELVRALNERGIDVRSHRSYQVDAASLQAADLILAMEGAHVQKATTLWPDVLDRIVPLRQAATVIDSAPDRPTSIDDLLRQVRARRDPADYLGSRWDVADPYGSPIRVYRRSISEIDSLVQTVMSALA